jgi:hypothetical protein
VIRQRIVYTRHSDGGVSVCAPTDWAIKWLGCGGFWGAKQHGWYDRQIESQIARGVMPDAARRYVKAMISGGCTTAEALGIIRDRDCGHLGHSIELQDVSDLPGDRWFRDAWKRSANGGPISIDLAKARPIQWRHIKSAQTKIAEQRALDLECFEPRVEFDEAHVRTLIKKATCVDQLRSIWPKELAHG